MQTLFSYGTLAYEQVQLDTFGRTLDTTADALPGYRLDKIEITDPLVLASSGEQFHPIVSFTGNPGDEVPGVRVLITEQELAEADGYEVDDYKRVRVTLKSGEQAWAYVDARDPGQ